ncbi:MAG: hypothetical protein VR67_17475 [Peptococcaceae bacterium BRH_c8a]|nr:MAG: hypothetical protein VR67_17475 [Peptococcaceae bacterium BRH_c8a]
MFVSLNHIAKVWHNVVCIAGAAIFFAWLMINANIFKTLSTVVVISYLFYLIYQNQNIMLKGVLKFGF